MDTIYTKLIRKIEDITLYKELYDILSILDKKP